MNIHIVFLVDDRLCECRQDELNALEGIVVASNNIINRIWIAIGIDQRHDRDAEFNRFSDRNDVRGWDRQR